MEEGSFCGGEYDYAAELGIQKIWVAFVGPVFFNIRFVG